MPRPLDRSGVPRRARSAGTETPFGAVRDTPSGAPRDTTLRRGSLLWRPKLRWNSQPEYFARVLKSLADGQALTQGHHVHHRNKKPRDHRDANLQQLTPAEHKAEHS